MYKGDALLICDGCAIKLVAYGHRGAIATRQLAHEGGWTTGKGRDLCQVCTAAHNAQAAQAVAT